MWEENPDLRLGQMIAVVAHEEYEKWDPFYLEDEELIEVAERIFR